MYKIAMYNTLRSKMKEQGVTIKQVSVWCQRTPACMFGKLAGKRDFTLTEAIRIKRGLGYKDKIEKLFKK